MRTREIDCLTNGAPHSAEARRFHDFFESIGSDARYHFVRCYTAFDLYGKMRKLRERDFEIAEFREMLRDCRSTAEKLVANVAVYRDFLADDEAARSQTSTREAAEARTREIYGRLFLDFGDDDYYDKSFELLRQRFEVNGIRFDRAEKRSALDAGCGNGRFTLALARLGFHEVHGVDFSERNIETAIRRRDARGMGGVHYRIADVLQLPFDDESFGFIFSNGVLHHTTRPIEQGLREIYRVLEPGGELFLALMEKPGGILFDTIELLRAVMRDVSLDFALRCFRSLGLSGFRLYSLVDHLLVPVNVRTAPEELERWFESVGFTSYRRMTRGVPSDQIELLRQLDGDDEEAVWKFGVGENKYLCVK